MSHSVGETVVLDGIESVIIYDNGSEADWGRYICVDKNHDLIYYIEGTDCLNEDINDPDSTDCINYNYKYGYEWGGYGIETGVTDSGFDSKIGMGLTNTNGLIELNLQPRKEGWYVIWNKVIEARNKISSNKWFVPSLQELIEIYNNKDNLLNLSLSKEYYYWSSTEIGGTTACFMFFSDGNYYNYEKSIHYSRVRLCRYTTDSELNSWISNETLSKDKLNRMETNLSSINSSYQTTNWQDNDIVTADKLNKLEQGLKEVKSDYMEHTWVDGEEITATKLNNISLNI